MTISFPAQNIAIQTPQDTIEPIWYEKLKALEAAINLLTSTAPGGMLGAWASYTPTFVANSGSFTSASAFGRYRQIGKTVTFVAEGDITTNGTGAGSVSLGLPVAASSAGRQVVLGRENGVSGKALAGQIAAGGSVVAIANYDGTYPGANGAKITIQGTYETA